MKVILTTNLKKIGKVGDLVKVKDGFARNYLFPNKMALRDTSENKEYFDKIKEEIKKKEDEKKEKSIEILENIKNTKISFTKEADDKNQLYGSVSKKEIINFLLEKDIKLLSDDIKILTPIRSLGEHTIEISPYVDISEKVKVFVNKS